MLDGCAPECDAVLRSGAESSEDAAPKGEYCCKEKEGSGEHSRHGSRVRRLEEPEDLTCANSEHTHIIALSLELEQQGEEGHANSTGLKVTFTKEGGQAEECELKAVWDPAEQQINFSPGGEHPCDVKNQLNFTHLFAEYDADQDSLDVLIDNELVRLRSCKTEEEEAQEKFLVATEIFVILVVLVVVSIFFEWASEAFEDYLEEHMPESVPVLKTIMKELTILGFLGLCAFLANKSGILPDISGYLFGETSEGRQALPEVFENIHMTLFFVMALFLLMGAVLVINLEVHEKRLRLYGKLCLEQPSQLLSEYLIRNLGYTERGLPGAETSAQESIVTSKGRYSLRRLFGCHKEITTKSELKEAVLFLAMRVRFIRAFGRQGGQLSGEGLAVTHDFDFAEYLANAQAETAEELIELTLGTWAMLGVFFFGVYGVMLIDDVEVQIICFIVFGYLNTLVSLYISYWMHAVQEKLTIPITGEKGRIFLLRQYAEARAKEGGEATLSSPPMISKAGSIQGVDESMPLMGDALDRSAHDDSVIEPSYSTDALSDDMKAFMRSVSDPNNACSGHSCRKHGLPSKHRLLFGKTLARFGQGPHFVLFLVRYVMLLTAIHLAMLVVFLAGIMLEPGQLSLPWLWIVIAALPAPYGMLVRPAKMVALWCTVCKIEQLADEENVKAVLETMRDRRVVAAIKMIGAMADARRLEEANKEGEAKKVLKVPVATTPLEKSLAEERRRNNRMMFDTFDTSGDGQLDPDEFKRLMEAVGTKLTASQIENMITEIELMTDDGEDAGDGEISFEEFHNYMEVGCVPLVCLAAAVCAVMTVPCMLLRAEICRRMNAASV